MPAAVSSGNRRIVLACYSLDSASQRAWRRREQRAKNCQPVRGSPDLGIAQKSGARILVGCSGLVSHSPSPKHVQNSSWPLRFFHSTYISAMHTLSFVRNRNRSIAAGRRFIKQSLDADHTYKMVQGLVGEDATAIKGEARRR